MGTTVEVTAALVAISKKLPDAILVRWAEVATQGKFEAHKALMTCKDWAGLATSVSFRVKSFEDVFSWDCPSLATMAKYQTEMQPVLVLAAMVIKQAAFFNVGGNINDEQAKETAYLLLEMYPHYNIKDFTFCFTMAKKGEFGALYDRLDGNVVLDWVKKYESIRSQEAAKFSQKAAQAQKEEGKSLHPDVVEVLKKAVAKHQPILKEKAFLTEEQFEAKKLEQQYLLESIYTNTQKPPEDDN